MIAGTAWLRWQETHDLTPDAIEAPTADAEGIEPVTPASEGSEAWTSATEGMEALTCSTEGMEEDMVEGAGGLNGLGRRREGSAAGRRELEREELRLDVQCGWGG